MLFHLIPKVLNPFDNITKIELLSISIPEASIQVYEDDLKVARPYPNKNFYVGMLNDSRKATSGLLLDLTDCSHKTFNVFLTWRLTIDEKTHLIEHQITNHIEGDLYEGGLITYASELGYDDGNFKFLWGSKHLNQTPAEISPYLNIEMTNLRNIHKTVYLPVMEKERLLEHKAATDRMPKTIWTKRYS